MIDWEQLYLKLPILLQNVCCSMLGLQIQKQRFGSGFHSLLTDFENRAYWSEKKIAEYRDQRLRDFVLHCSTSVPYYRRLFRELGLRSEDIRSLEDLKQLPVLTKAHVQDSHGDFCSEAVPKRHTTVIHTSGTTGAGLRLAATKAAIQEQWACWWRFRRSHGISLNTRCAYFGGRSVVPIEQQKPPFWRYNIAGRQTLFSAYHMSPDYLDFYISQLKKSRAPWLHGYPSLLSILASHLLATGKDLGYDLRWVTVGAENLLPHQAELIERAFGVRPIQSYGMAEACANISQCDLGKLHVDEDFAGVEFLDTPEANAVKVIGTNFSNPATPLLRYDVGDTVTLDRQNCGCGRPGRIVSNLDGRQEDYIVLKNGARLGRLDHVFKDLIRIRESQIVQKDAGSIVVRVVRAPGYSYDDQQHLLRELRKRLGPDMQISFDYPRELSRSKNGKLRFVVTERASEQLTI